MPSSGTTKTISGTGPTPWYESNLLWGPLALGVGILLTVIAAMEHDLRWLLWFAWPCFGAVVWWLARRTHKKVLISITGIVVVGAGLLWLGIRLRPQQVVTAQMPSTPESNAHPQPQMPPVSLKPETPVKSHTLTHSTAPKKPVQASVDTPPSPGSIIQSNSGNGINIQQGTTGANSPIIDSPITIGPPPLKINWSANERPSQDSTHRYYLEVAVTPNVAWQPVALQIKSSASIKAITPYGMVMQGDGYVSQQDDHVGYVTAEGPTVGPGQPFVLGVFGDEPFTIVSVELSKVPRRRNVLDGNP